MSSEENEKSMIALLKEISNKLDSSSEAATEAAEKKAAGHRVSNILRTQSG